MRARNAIGAAAILASTLAGGLYLSSDGDYRQGEWRVHWVQEIEREEKCTHHIVEGYKNDVLVFRDVIHRQNYRHEDDAAKGRADILDTIKSVTKDGKSPHLP